jgi:hypothetical protein
MNPAFLSLFRSLVFGVSMLLPAALQADVPQQLNHQGRVAVNGVNFDGNGQFKFALVNANGTVSYWSNDGTSSAGSEPTSPVTLPVTKGLYSVLLGNTTLNNMTALPPSALDHDDVRLRIWFNDGSSRGSQLITPDQRLAAAPYALLAAKSTSADGFSGSLAGEVTGTQGATSIAAATVTGKPLTGYVSGAGTLSAFEIGRSIEQQSRIILEPLLEQVTDGRFVYTDKGRLAMEFQKKYGDVLIQEKKNNGIKI